MAIVALERPDIETNIQGGVGFSFSESAATKLYQMMSNYLYSDKEYAVISELSANAIDAHQLVGKQEVPIKIQLPTRFESEFVVRDFGPGLSEDHVYKFLTAYGESSKGGTNDQIGFWGIGSKSPAAVSDSWSIISHHAGKKMHFEVFVTTDGIPTLKKIFEGDSDETGLEVRVPIATAQYQQWTNAAERAFKYYPIKPTVNQKLNYSAVDYHVKGNGWARAKGYHKGGRLIVTMREYTLDFNKVMSHLPASSPIRNMLNGNFNGFDMFFGVGEIDLSISREQIQYNDKTIKAIVDRIQKMYDEMTAIITADLDTATNSVEYRKLASVWHNTYDIGVSYLTNTINGKHGITKIPQHISSITAENVDLDHMSVVYNFQVKSLKKSFSCWGYSAIRKSSSWDYKNSKYDNSVSLSIPDLDRIVLVTRDVKDAQSRIKHSGDKSKFYLIMDKNVFSDEFTVVNASSFEKPPRQTKEAKENITNFYIMEGNRFLRVDAASLKTARESKTSVAVQIINAISASNNPDAMTKEVAWLRRIGWTIIGYKGDVKPIGIPTVSEGMKNLFNGLTNDAELKKELNDMAIRRMFTQIQYHTASIYAVRQVIRSSKFDTITEAYKPMIDYFRQHGSTARGSQSTKFNTWTRLCEFLGVDSLQSGVADATATMAVLDARYPMLKYLQATWYTLSADNITEANGYVTMVDRNS